MRICDRRMGVEQARRLLDLAQRIGDVEVRRRTVPDA